jgi:hypothetical protein
MTEHDPFNRLLHEWRAPDLPSSLEARIAGAYRTKLTCPYRQPPFYRRWWTARISIPVPLLGLALLLVAMLFWFRSKSAPGLPPETAGVVTRVNATGFEPLPNGRAHLVPVKETHQ